MKKPVSVGLLLSCMALSTARYARVRRQNEGFWWLSSTSAPESSSSSNNPVAAPLDSGSIAINNLSDLAALFDDASGGTAEDCECVPYYQCKEGNIITDGEGIIDIRWLNLKMYLHIYIHTRFKLYNTLTTLIRWRIFITTVFYVSLGPEAFQ